MDWFEAKGCEDGKARRDGKEKSPARPRGQVD
jgi:hypothetical protein